MGLELLDYLEEFNMVSVSVRLLLAMLFGGLLGMERAMKRRAAGLRTFALVSLGSACAMVTNQYLFLTLENSGDPSRMAAQVISGIGFLGVGTIVVTAKNHVTGLTTAAELWTSAIMGLAVGSGFIWGGSVSMVLILVCMRFMKYISKYQEKHNRILTVYLEIGGQERYLEVLEFIYQKEFEIKSIEKKRQKPIIAKDITILIDIDMKRRTEHSIIINEMRKLEGIHYLEEIH